MSKYYEINGGRTLSGEIEILGAKNAINKQLVASLLTTEPCVFEGVPKTTEVFDTLDMLTEVGAKFEWGENHTLTIQTTKIISSVIGHKYSGVNRMPVLFLGPLLNRVGEVTIPLMGGCPIGPRPIDFHLAALTDMGAEITESEISITAKATRLRGLPITLPFPSIGATENILFSACLAKGTTVIKNAAIEPEIIDTILCLQKMGARILVDVNRTIVIEGVENLMGTYHKVIPDRMEAASFAIAAIATQGDIMIKNAQQEHLMTFLNTIHKMGANFNYYDNGIRISADKPLKAVHIQTDVHPGFMTDWQQPLVVALTQAKGASVIHETMYEDRFGYTSFLKKMGANIELSTACLGNSPCRYKDKNYQHSAVIIGATKLHGMDIVIPDLRAGFAYICAAFIAEGKSTIHGLRHVQRGHPDLVARLKLIGADIKEFE